MIYRGTSREDGNADHDDQLRAYLESKAQQNKALYEKAMRERTIPLKIYDSLKDLTEDEVVIFEGSLGHRLPEDYREFLLRNNGGFSNLTSFVYQDADGLAEGGVDRFFGITGSHDRDSDSLQKNIALFQSYDETPPDLMPIADDGVGNFILLSIYGSDKGQVSYWQHEVDPMYGNRFLIADSFREFLAKLYERDDEDDE